MLKYIKLKTITPIIATDKEHLKRLIRKEMWFKGKQCDLNHLDVSRVTDFFQLFYHSKFNGDISKWNVSNVQSMRGLFFTSKFKGDLSEWKPYKAYDLTDMFNYCTAPHPYWFIENKEQRIKAIDSYSLTQELQEKLSPRNNIQKKLKYNMKTTIITTDKEHLKKKLN